jgi:hypothetical protein
MPLKCSIAQALACRSSGVCPCAVLHIENVISLHVLSSGIPSHPDIVPVRTGRRRLQQHATTVDRELERRRRSIMCAYATCTGLLTPPYPPPNCLERTIRHSNGGGALRLQCYLHSRTGLHTSSGLNPASRTLLATPTGHSPTTKNALTKASLAALPRCHTFAEFKHRLSTVPRLRGTAGPLQTSQQERTVTTNSTPWLSSTVVNSQVDMMVVSEGSEQAQVCTGQDPSKLAHDSPAEDPITKVNVSHISDPHLKDPMRCFSFPGMCGCFESTHCVCCIRVLRTT